MAQVATKKKEKADAEKRYPYLVGVGCSVMHGGYKVSEDDGTLILDADGKPIPHTQHKREGEILWVTKGEYRNMKDNTQASLIAATDKDLEAVKRAKNKGKKLKIRVDLGNLKARAAELRARKRAALQSLALEERQIRRIGDKLEEDQAQTEDYDDENDEDDEDFSLGMDDDPDEDDDGDTEDDNNGDDSTPPAPGSTPKP